MKMLDFFDLQSQIEAEKIQDYEFENLWFSLKSNFGEIRKSRRKWEKWLQDCKKSPEFELK